MKVKITSDWHIDHHKLAPVRGFSDVNEMNEAIVDLHNSHVNKDDIVIFQGDAGLGNPTNVAKIIERLHGKKILILGNHDKPKNRKKYVHLFDEVHNGYLETKHHIDGNPVLFVHSHYPLATWNMQYHGSIHLHGHSHMRGVNPFHPRKMDVSMDECTINDDGTKTYKICPPLTIEQIVEAMRACEGRTYKWIVKWQAIGGSGYQWIDEFKSTEYELKPFLLQIRSRLRSPVKIISAVKIEELTANWDGEL